MPEHVYKTIELVGSSTTSVEDAIRKAVAKASETLRNLRWFEVVESRGQIEGGERTLVQRLHPVRMLVPQRVGPVRRGGVVLG